MNRVLEKLSQLKHVVKTSDGCTASPDLNFKECCLEHDFYYATKSVSRAEADKRLRECIKEKWGGNVVPWIYWVGVRAFGIFPWRSKKRSEKV